LLSAFVFTRWLDTILLALDDNGEVVLAMFYIVGENRQIDTVSSTADLDRILNADLSPCVAKLQYEPPFDVLADVFFGSIVANLLVNVITNLSIWQRSNDLRRHPTPLSVR
jgi:hypothetical protein